MYQGNLQTNLITTVKHCALKPLSFVRAIYDNSQNSLYEQNLKSLYYSITRIIFIKFIRPQQLSRDKMYSTQCSLELGTQRYIDICASNNDEPRIDLREFKQTEKSKFPTKKGISLNLDLFKILSLATDMVDTAMNKNKDLHYHIGGNIFLLTFPNCEKRISLCWHKKILETRKRSEPCTHHVPTRKEICLRPAKYVNLKSNESNLEKEIPQLETIFSCFMRDEQQNQLRMLRCLTCIPFGIWKLAEN